MDRSYHTSTLNTLLPSSLQVRLPRIPSIRRSFSSLSIPSITRSTDINSSSDLEYRKHNRDIESPKLNRTSSSDRSFDHEEIALCFYEIQKFNEQKLLNLPNTDLEKGTEGGIIWKFVHYGINLLKLAISESTSPKVTNIPFVRHLYVHSLTYLLRALPSDLTKDECKSIQAALPKRLINYQDQHPPKLRAEIRQTSFLHRTLASTIVQLFILFQLLLPYTRLFLSIAWQYQNQHQVISRLSSTCVELGIGVGEAIKGLGETKIGDLLITTVQWLIEGIIGGVGEGLIEVLGKKDAGDLVTTHISNLTKREIESSQY